MGPLAARRVDALDWSGVGKPSSSIYFQLSPLGGIRLRPRRRSWMALTLSEREEISRGIVARQSIWSMAV